MVRAILVCAYYPAQLRFLLHARRHRTDSGVSAAYYEQVHAYLSSHFAHACNRHQSRTEASMMYLVRARPEMNLYPRTAAGSSLTTCEICACAFPRSTSPFFSFVARRATLTPPTNPLASDDARDTRWNSSRNPRPLGNRQARSEQHTHETQTSERDVFSFHTQRLIAKPVAPRPPASLHSLQPSLLPSFPSFEELTHLFHRRWWCSR